MAAQPRGIRKPSDRTQSTRDVQQNDKGIPPPLSREHIALTAVALLDAQGVHGLTMRRLADALGSGVMSLYWHVNNKEEVFDLALDSVLAYREALSTSTSKTWRADVMFMLEDWRACMLRHPWSVSLLPRRVMGPSMLARLERLSSALSTAGVPGSDLNAAVWSLWNYVMGATITRSNFDFSSEEIEAAQQRLNHLSELYPTIERSRLLLDDDWDGVFRKGLDCLLDGLLQRPKKSQRR